MNILYVAPIFINANASAGAETINIYINELANMGHEVSVISFSEGRFVNENINYYTINISKNNRILAKSIKLLGWIFNPGYRYLYKTTFSVRKAIQQELRKIDNVDIVILETASSYLLWDIIKKFFPNAKLVASVHDVAYQGSYRRLLLENNKIKKFIRRRYCTEAKKVEINALSHCDLIMPHNVENINYLLQNPKLNDKMFFHLIPYYETNYKHNDVTASHDILFYGLMSRPENSESILWFLENVFDSLDNQFRLVIMGGNPPKNVLEKKSNRVVVTGFVDENTVQEYFENCFCMVVPLLFGSGIKTKVLSALHAGIPVLTNGIGIEGIPAVKDQDYLFCKNADDYIENINMLQFNPQKYQSLCKNARMVTNASFNHHKCAEELQKKLYSLL